MKLEGCHQIVHPMMTDDVECQQELDASLLMLEVTLTLMQKFCNGNLIVIPDRYFK